MNLDFRNDSFSPVSNRAVDAEGTHKRRGISMIDAAHFFGDNESAAQWLEKARWGDGPIVCPHCHGERTSRTTRSGSPYRCKEQGLPQAFLGKAMLDRRITFADLMADNGLPSGSRERNAIYPDRRPKFNRKS